MLALGCSKHIIASQAHNLNFMSFFTCLFVIKGFVDIEEEVERERIRESINTLEGMQSLLFALQLANSIRETVINGVTKHKNNKDKMPNLGSGCLNSTKQPRLAGPSHLVLTIHIQQCVLFLGDYLTKEN